MGFIVNANIACARDTRRAHAARDHRRVRGHAPARGDNRFGGVHAVNVFGAGFYPHQNNFAARLFQLFGFIGTKDHLANRRARRGRKPHCNNIARRVRIKRRMQELIERERLNAHQGFIFCNLSRLGHIHCNLQRGARRALTRTGLQHPELALLDGKFNVLHIAVVTFELDESIGELCVNFWQSFFHRQGCLAHILAGNFGERLRRTDTRHHIFALGVDEELPVISILACAGVAGKGHACCRGIAHIAKDHSLNIQRCAPRGRNIIEAAIDNRALIHPAAKDRVNRALKLLARVLRKITSQRRRDSLFILANDSFPIAFIQLCIKDIAFIIFMALKNIFECVVMYAQHNV